MSDRRQYFDVSIGTILKIAAVVIALALLYLTREILVILFLAVIIASAVSLFAGTLERYRVPRLIGVLSIYLAGIGFFGLVLYFIIPPIVDEIKQMAVILPDYYETAARQIFKTTSGISPDYAKNAQNILLNLGEKIKELTSGIFNIVSALFGSAVSFMAIIVISFYLSIQKKGVEDFLRLITPQGQEEYVIDVWIRVEKKLGNGAPRVVFFGFVWGGVVFCWADSNRCALCFALGCDSRLVGNSADRRTDSFGTGGRINGHYHFTVFGSFDFDLLHHRPAG